MRYEASESTFAAAQFDSGDTVTITIRDFSDNSVVVNQAACSEHDGNGLFKYEFNPNPDPTTKKEYSWVMTNGSYNAKGKFVFHGYVNTIKSETDKIQTIDNLVDAIKAKTDNLPTDTASTLQTIGNNVLTNKKVLTGRWKMTNNQFILYDSDNTTPLFTFNLKDGAGNATMINPMERTPV